MLTVVVSIVFVYDHIHCMMKVVVQSPFLRVFKVVLEAVLSTESAQGDELLPINVVVKRGFQVL